MTRTQAARRRAATEKLARIDRALAVLPELEAIKKNSNGKPSKNSAARVSTTDVDARRMKMPGGAIQPAYNVPFATDVNGRAIVGVAGVNTGSDAQQSQPMREQVERRSGREVKEHLFDGGFVNKDMITEAESCGGAIYAPLPRNRQGEPCTSGRNDSAGVAAWRDRMTTPEAAPIYHQRASTVETVNGEVRQTGDLDQMIWKVPEMISYLSDYFELAAGDVIMSGTPSGVASVARGDVMEAEIAGVGALRVTVG